MKYRSIASFKEHLAKEEGRRLYLLIVPDDFERGKLIDAICRSLPAPTRLSGEDADVKSCLDAIQGMSLFGQSAVILDEVEKMPKKAQELLGSQLGSSSSVFVIGSRSKTPLSALIEQLGIVLDLLDEKPWEREKRLSEEMRQRAHHFGKVLALEAAQLLLERLGADPALLVSEVDKLICYVGERGRIESEDVLNLSPASKASTLWQKAEGAIWDKEPLASIDQSAFYALIPALRSQLHLGMTLAVLIEEGKSADQWHQYLPKLWPKILEKRSSQAARLGSRFFQRGLQKLFEMEVASRSYSTQYQALVDLFFVEIHAR